MQRNGPQGDPGLDGSPLFIFFFDICIMDFPWSISCSNLMMNPGLESMKIKVTLQCRLPGKEDSSFFFFFSSFETKEELAYDWITVGTFHLQSPCQSPGYHSLIVQTPPGVLLVHTSWSLSSGNQTAPFWGSWIPISILSLGIRTIALQSQTLRNLGHFKLCLTPGNLPHKGRHSKSFHYSARLMRPDCVRVLMKSTQFVQSSQLTTKGIPA